MGINGTGHSCNFLMRVVVLKSTKSVIKSLFVLHMLHATLFPTGADDVLTTHGTPPPRAFWPHAPLSSPSLLFFICIIFLFVFICLLLFFGAFT